MGGPRRARHPLLRREGRRLSTLALLAHAIVWPGLGLLLVGALGSEWIDRKLAARAQSRVGPPLVQPLADFLKLLAKEDVRLRTGAALQRFAPRVAFVAIVTAFLALPLGAASPFAFEGDIVVVLFLLSLPPVLLFIVGWTSGNPFARVGSVRGLAQAFAFEVAFFLAALGPAIAAGRWSLADIAEAQRGALWWAIAQPLGFFVVLVGLQARLERAPFDAPHADTELVAGALVDVAGRRLAFWRLASDAALFAGAALVATLFLGGAAVPFIPPLYPALGAMVVAAKAMLLVAILSLASAALSRLRIDQSSAAGWRILAPLALAQIAIVLLVPGMIV